MIQGQNASNDILTDYSTREKNMNEKNTNEQNKNIYVSINNWTLNAIPLKASSPFYISTVTIDERFST